MEQITVNHLTYMCVKGVLKQPPAPQPHPTPAQTDPLKTVVMRTFHFC